MFTRVCGWRRTVLSIKILYALKISSQKQNSKEKVKTIQPVYCTVAKASIFPVAVLTSRATLNAKANQSFLFVACERLRDILVCHKSHNVRLGRKSWHGRLATLHIRPNRRSLPCVWSGRRVVKIQTILPCLSFPTCLTLEICQP